jgi:hypothetical protein
MTSSPNLDQMSPDQLRALAAQLLSQVETMGKTVETMGKKINRDQTVIEKLTHEIAQLKRLKFAKRSEQMNPEQASLLDDLIDTDIAAIEAELQALQTMPATTEKKQKPKRTALPAEFPRTLIHHEPDNTTAPVAAPSNASVKTSARSWTTRRAYSLSSAMCAENGSVMTAKR